ncbi:MAG: hypothetical protein N5P05_000145 [Chroococcopsis gigantea SAG 12.99]|jgi:hypothetical protein|nr:hypothetical protein [Chlorogloea purpurea SAG 13.99]MDV2998539.1 hypothetical protein [Chroococcopsis gigantea SAG 12.99]
MNILPKTTQRRLKKIPLVPSVWEGDRRPVSALKTTLEPNEEGGGECIIWVDGGEHCVRAMEVVPAQMGPEAIIRTLLRAIESPQSPAKPGRPQKIIVRNREIQFFLRGVLQDLDINIDYVPDLPLIDDLFRSFEEYHNNRPPSLPPNLEPLLTKTASDLWKLEPWRLLADHDIISVKVNRWGMETLYICVMGMLGQEYGVILYRSLESLKQFRSSALAEKSLDRLEQAFLAQDCWFLSFESLEDEDEEEEDVFDLADLHPSQIHPVFGSVHPYEGIRPHLDEEEASVIQVALQALLRFFKGNSKALAASPIGSVKKTYSIDISFAAETEKTLSVEVATETEISQEFMRLIELSEGLDEEDEDEDEDYDFDDDDDDGFHLSQDFVPDRAHLSLGMIPWDMIAGIREQPKIYHQSAIKKQSGEGLPVVIIQTSRPKAKEMIEKIQYAQGIDGIGFNPGEDPFSDDIYDLGIIKMVDGNFFLFGEFPADNPTHVQARKNWDRRTKDNKGYCGLIIAMGVTGSSKGNPKPSDMLALFETKALTVDDFGIGTLTMTMDFD